MSEDLTYTEFSFQLNIHQFKCLARFGLMHIVATNVCVWIRTVFKEGIKDIASYRVSRGEGVSEDFMIKGSFMFISSLTIYCQLALFLNCYYLTCINLI